MSNSTNDMRQMTALGRSIEDKSFAIIDEEAGPHNMTPEQWEVTRRVIHATADFEFKSLMKFSADAIASGIAALRNGCPILVDVKMISVGLNAERLAAYGCEVYSYISDPDVIENAKSKNSTRAIESIRKAHSLGHVAHSIVAIGNAPTALLEIAKLAGEGVRPALIIGVPVGFVSAAESKEAVTPLGIPYIVAQGRKGGSAIAVAIIHALLKLSVELPTEAN